MPPRIQIALSAPFTRVDYVDGTTTRGMGDAYGAVKMTLLDPAEEGRPFGLAIIPVVEFLSTSSVEEGAGRTFWALPVAIEKRFESFRTYGTVGYFSRGSAFAAGAAEVPVSSKVTVTGTLSYARSLEDDPLAEELDAEGAPTHLGRPHDRIPEVVETQLARLVHGPRAPVPALRRARALRPLPAVAGAARHGSSRRDPGLRSSGSHASSTRRTSERCGAPMLKRRRTAQYYSTGPRVTR
jgi:hypothetical protein